MKLRTFAFATLLAGATVIDETVVKNPTVLPRAIMLAAESMRVPPAAAQAVRNVPRISIEEVKVLMAKKRVLLIDVRDPQSFAAGHLPGAINVPFDHIPDHVEAWKGEKRLLVTYCA